MVSGLQVSWRQFVAAIALLCNGQVWASKTVIVCDMGVIGAGCAGLPAAAQGGQLGRSVVLITGPRSGGQLMGSQLVENMPGIAPQPGYQVIDTMWAQAEAAHVKVLYDTVERIVRNDNGGYTLHLADGSLCQVKTVVIATGGCARLLGVPGEDLYLNRSVFTCAECDIGHAHDKDIYAVGGGDGSVDGMQVLSTVAKSGALLVRDGRLRATPRMQERLTKLANVQVEHGVEIVAFVGDGEHLTHVDVLCRDTGIVARRPASAVWEFIGFIPETSLVANMADRDATEGYIIVDDEQRVRYKGVVVPGLYAAGDVASDHRFHQADYAAAHGKLAATFASRYLDDVR